MAKIYISHSYQQEDRQFAVQLAKRLRASGHNIFLSSTENVAQATDLSKLINDTLKLSDIFIVILSKNAEKSQNLLMEVGAARAYASASDRMIFIPIILGDAQIPYSVREFQVIFQRDCSIEKIIKKIEHVLSTFIGRRAAIEFAETKAAEKIQNNAADYIRVAIDSLQKLEGRDRALSYLWYFMGFASLVFGISFALAGLTHASKQTGLATETLILVSLKTIVVIGLLVACAKYAFSLGKSYSSESLKSSDRIHAIRFGEFYLRAFGDKIKWEELKEVFQHWNIDRNSSFSSLDTSHFDPKIIESLVDMMKTGNLKKAP